MGLHRKMRVYTHIRFLVRITTPRSNVLSAATIRIEYLHLPLNIVYSGVHFGIYISLFRKVCQMFLLRIYTDFFDITLKVNALNFCTKFCTKLTFFLQQVPFCLRFFWSNLWPILKYVSLYIENYSFLFSWNFSRF